MIKSQANIATRHDILVYFFQANVVGNVATSSPMASARPSVDGAVARARRAPLSPVARSRGCGVVSYVNRCSFLRTAFACIFAHYNTFKRILAHFLRDAF